MSKTNRLSKLVKSTSKFPQKLRRIIWSRAFGRVVPMVGTAKIQFVEMHTHKVVVKLENHKGMQNHIGQIHACAMTLIAETATGFVTAMNVPDHVVMLIKSLKIDFKRPTKGAMTATASLTEQQQHLMQNTDKGETIVSVQVTDESNEEPILCEMLWAWVSKDQLKKS